MGGRRGGGVGAALFDAVALAVSLLLGGSLSWDECMGGIEGPWPFEDCAYAPSSTWPPFIVVLTVAPVVMWLLLRRYRRMI